MRERILVALACRHGKLGIGDVERSSHGVVDACVDAVNTSRTLRS
jgi:hypothetical protein